MVGNRRQGRRLQVLATGAARSRVVYIPAGQMHITSTELVDILKGKGHRITEARRAVCEVIAASHAEHLDATAIHDKAVHDLGVDIDLSTVYRTLEALEDAGAVRHAHLGEAAVYHLAEEQPHQHLVCSRCGTTTAIPASDLEEFLASISERTGFIADIEHFAVSGLCASCAAL
jgi:Fur family transcriptional regulator, ferric uptake regulator